MDPTLGGRGIIVDGRIFSGAYTLYFAVYTSLLDLLPVWGGHWPQYGLLGEFWSNE